jgi:hypothetical protein
MSKLYSVNNCYICKYYWDNSVNELAIYFDSKQKEYFLELTYV